MRWPADQKACGGERKVFSLFSAELERVLVRRKPNTRAAANHRLKRPTMGLLRLRPRKDKVPDQLKIEGWGNHVVHHYRSIERSGSCQVLEISLISKEKSVAADMP